MAGYGDKEGDGRRIFDGKLTVNLVSFTTKTQLTSDNRRFEDVLHFYKGKVEGDTIEFTMTSEGTTFYHKPIQFSAHRY